MNKRQKVEVLSKIRQALLIAIRENDSEYICNIYGRQPDCDDDYMRSQFPELANEIERTGKLAEPDYRFPSALTFKGNDGKLSYLYGAAYNKEKLKLISRVRKQLTGGKW